MHLLFSVSYEKLELQTHTHTHTQTDYHILSAHAYQGITIAITLCLYLFIRSKKVNWKQANIISQININAGLQKESSKAMEWLWTLSFQWQAVPRYSQNTSICNLTCYCMLFRTLLQYFVVTERHTERELQVYSTNILYNETAGVYKQYFVVAERHIEREV